MATGQQNRNDLAIENAVIGYYLTDALPLLKSFGFSNLSIVTAFPGKSRIPLNMPRVVRFSSVDSATGVVTIVYEDYLKGGAI